jgi:8-oxo-dGTP pyrophosphatase MutT (NUDIX family)
MTDEDAERFAYLAEGNAKQARKRVATDVLITDSAGRVLLVDPTYKPDWDMPGGMVEANEPPRRAGERELREELGLDLQLGRLLYLEWVPPQGPWDDMLMFIFDGGTLDEQAVANLRLADGELGRFAFVSVDEARELLRPYVWERLRRAVETRESGGYSYRET